MTVRLGVDIEVLVPEGGEPTDTERSLIEGIEWVKQLGPHTSAYHEVMAHLAGMALRRHWADADLYRGLEEQRAVRLAKAAARKAARGVEAEE